MSIARALTIKVTLPLSVAAGTSFRGRSRRSLNGTFTSVSKPSSTSTTSRRAKARRLRAATEMAEVPESVLEAAPRRNLAREGKLPQGSHLLTEVS